MNCTKENRLCIEIIYLSLYWYQNSFLISLMNNFRLFEKQWKIHKIKKNNVNLKFCWLKNIMIFNARKTFNTLLLVNNFVVIKLWKRLKARSDEVCYGIIIWQFMQASKITLYLCNSTISSLIRWLQIMYMLPIHIRVMIMKIVFWTSLLLILNAWMTFWAILLFVTNLAVCK